MKNLANSIHNAHASLLALEVKPRFKTDAKMLTGRVYRIRHAVATKAAVLTDLVGDLDKEVNRAQNLTHGERVAIKRILQKLRTEVDINGKTWSSTEKEEPEKKRV